MGSPLHSWQVTPKQAIAIQSALRSRVVLNPPPRPVRTVAGIDVSYDAETATMIAGVVVLNLADLSLLEYATAVTPATFPYVPGLLSFREIPAVLLAFRKIKSRPDCLICDGQGIAHPRRIGLASHLGIWLGLPTIGCAKSVLVGEFAPPGVKRGSRSFMTDRGDRVGVALRTRDHVKPVFVSPGHQMTIARAAELVLDCCTRFRLPEPTRRAHLLVNSVRIGLRNQRSKTGRASVAVKRKK